MIQVGIFSTTMENNGAGKVLEIVWRYSTPNFPFYI